MKQIIKIIGIFILISILKTSCISAVVVKQNFYQPTQKENIAYQVCSNYVQDLKSLVLNGKTIEQQKTIYSDFLKDYNNGNCGEIEKKTKTEINGVITLYDPFNNKVIYEGIKNLNPNLLNTSPYQQSLKKVQLKTKIINQYLLTDFKYSKWEKINSTLQKLYAFEFNKNKSINEEEKQLKNIVNTFDVNNDKHEMKKVSNSNQTKIYLLIASLLTSITISLIIIIKYFKNKS